MGKVEISLTMAATSEEIAANIEVLSKIKEALDTSSKSKVKKGAGSSSAAVKSEKLEKEEAKEPEKKEEEESSSSSEISLADLLKIVPEKAKAGFRDDIKEKLQELGADRVTKLEEKHYDDFKEFLDGLK